MSFISNLCFFRYVNYFYDDSGRLSRAVKSTEGVIYQYDEVGNLLSVIRETTTASPPVLQAINPDVLFIGSTNLIIITGLNLITTKEVKSTNPSLSIKVITVTDKSIKAEIAVSMATAPGTVAITVTTLYGSANIGVTLSPSKLTFSPGQITLTSGDTGSITVSIFPSIGRDVTIAINNSNSAIVSVERDVFSINCIIAFLDSHAHATFVIGSACAVSTNPPCLGAFDPVTNIEVELPPDGILNYTTVNISLRGNCYF